MSKSRSDRPVRLAVTPGEPAGIGPDICIDVASRLPEQAVFFADPDLLNERAIALGVELRCNDYLANGYQAGAMNVCPIRLSSPCTPGTMNADNAAYVLSSLAAALAACQAGELDALVTGPVNKAIINEAGVPFSGHTEWLADQTGTEKVVMMLAGGGLRVALVTTHLPISEVSSAISRESLAKTLRILNQDLEGRFRIENPRIIVCGLNPHAGESGHLGREEIEVIEPVISELSAGGMQLIGPLPADTAFTQSTLQQGDVVLAMYHDQGLPVLKHAAFGDAVNITLGLPIIRTSVDHGTALDIAGSGKADSSSLLSACTAAAELAAAERT